jgi:tRNA nucleotidyltransferase (CCA-adding enzyme)
MNGDLLKEMGLSPGRVFKKLLDACWDAQLDGLIHTTEEAIALVRRLLEEGIAGENPSSSPEKQVEERKQTDNR